MLAGVYVLIVAPVLDLYAQREAMLDNRQVLAPHLNAAVEQLPALRARLAEARAAASTHNITLDGASDAIASASLQSRIEELAASAGVTIGSTQGVTTENRGSYRWIGLHFVIGGEYEAIIKLLSAIESATPPLVLGNLQLHNAPRARAEAMGVRLDAGFEVYALRGTGSSVVSKQ